MRRTRSRWPALVTAALLAVGGVWGLAGCGDDDSGTEQDAGPYEDASSLPWAAGPITPQELHDALEHKDFLLINVHVPYAGEIAGTDAHIPYDDIDAIVDFIGTNLDLRVVIYCLTDHMTDIAEPQIEARGYTGIRSLEGGMTGWQQAGFTIEQ